MQNLDLSQIKKVFFIGIGGIGISALAKMCKARGLEAIAADELLESFRKTLNGTQDGYTKAGIYEETPISGLKVNKNDNSLQLFGLERNRVVLVPGVHKTVNSSEKTIAKNKLRKSLPVGKFKEFAIDPGNIASARLEGTEIVFDPTPEYMAMPSVIIPVAPKAKTRKPKVILKNIFRLYIIYTKLSKV
jgi:hypothetical protein